MFSIEVHWEAKQLHTLEDAQVGFFCYSPKRRKFGWVFFPGIFGFDRDNSKIQGQTSTSDFKNDKRDSCLRCCHWTLYMASILSTSNILDFIFYNHV